MKYKKLFITTLLFILLNTVNQSYAVGLQGGVSIDLPKNFFVEGDAFSNYYGGDIINYNYGFKGNFGYKIFGVSAYGLGGVQHVGFSDGQRSNFKNNTSPLYGVGVGYNLPLLNMGFRIENTYFNLDKKNGNTEHFNNIDLGVIFVF